MGTVSSSRGMLVQPKHVLLALMLALLGWQLVVLSDPTRGRPDDFVAFWASARALVESGDPYDPSTVLAVERTAHWTAPHAYRVWEPPWIFPLLVPFAVLPYQFGRVLWFIVQLGAATAAADLLWRLYGGDPARRGLAWVVTFLFAPTIIAWRTGQVSGLVLLGLAIFLVCERSGRDLAAGVALALAAMKPHVVYLFWPILLARTIMTCRWRLVVGCVGAVTILTAVASAYRLSLAVDFITTIGSDPPRQGASTLGTVLRLASHGLVGGDFYGLVFVAPVVGLVWAGMRVARRASKWSWSAEMPLVILVSLALAPFAWVYDEIIAVVPLVQIVAVASGGGGVPGRPLVAGFVVVDLAMFAMNVARVDPFWYVWVPFALLGLYVLARPSRELPGR